jgi:G:T/U-mismatch repair DNA glycosylase
MTDNEYPKYEFTFEILQTLFEQGTIHIKYTPLNTNLTVYEYNIPILPNFDPNNLKQYVAQWAPNDRWFAQETILNHTNLIGTTG